MSAERRTLLKVILALLLSLLAGYLWWQRGQVPSHRALNERYALAYLKSLAAAEVEFRAKDCDGNGIADFWTGDVAGLYHHGALIDRRVAEADARPLRPLVPAPIPKYSYLFIAMDEDGSQAPSEELRQDTDKKSGKVHHLARFAFCAYSAVYRAGGVQTFIINERATIFRRDTGGKPVLRWPSENELHTEWSQVD